MQLGKLQLLQLSLDRRSTKTLFDVPPGKEKTPEQAVNLCQLAESFQHLFRAYYGYGCDEGSENRLKPAEHSKPLLPVSVIGLDGL